MIKKYLLFILFVLSITSVYAQAIEDITVHVKIYNTTLEFTNPDYAGNNKNLSLNITNGIIILQDIDFPIIFAKNETVDKSIAEQYANCLTLKGNCEVEKTQFNTAWNNCNNLLNSCNNENNQSAKDLLSSCKLEKQGIQNDLDKKTKEFNELEEKSKSNSNWIFAAVIGTAFIVFIITRYISGRIGNPNLDKSQDEFNTQRGY